jgi:HK97 family phage portal protein
VGGLYSGPSLWVQDVAFAPRTTTASGEAVTHDSAMALSVYYACLNNISQDLAKLPLQLRRKRDGRGSDEATTHPVRTLVRRRPNPLMGAMQFRMTMQHRLLSWGNAYAEIVRDRTGRVLELWPVHPYRIKPVIEKDGRTLTYEYRADGVTGEPILLAPRDVLHLRGLGSGIEGYSVLRFASETLGLGLAAQRHAAQFYGDGLGKRMVAVAKAKLDPKGRQAFRERLKGDRENDPMGARKLPFLEGDIDLKDVGIPPDEAQFLETRSYQVSDVARWFRMSLGKLQHNEKAQGWSTLEAANRDYATDALQPWAGLWEEECWLKLLTEGEQNEDRLYFQHVFQALLRADFTARYEGYVKGVTNGWLSPNDVRDLEDMNPIDDPWADEYRQQAQMVGSSTAQTEPVGDDAALSADALHPVFMATAERMVKIESNECARAAAKHASDKAAFDAAVEKFRQGHAATVAGAFAPVLFSGCLLLSAASLMPNEEAIQAAYLAMPAMQPADRAEARAGVLSAAMLALLPAVSVSA